MVSDTGIMVCRCRVQNLLAARVLPAALANARDLAFQGKQTEHVSAKAELAIDTLTTSRYQATVTNAHFCAVPWKFLEAYHVTSCLEFGTLGSILGHEALTLFVSSDDGLLSHYC